MRPSFEDPETDALALQLSDLTGETPMEAIRTSLRNRLHEERLRRVSEAGLEDALTKIARRCAALPALDDRSTDEIIGYDPNGLPG